MYIIDISYWPGILTLGTWRIVIGQYHLLSMVKTQLKNQKGYAQSTKKFVQFIGITWWPCI